MCHRVLDVTNFATLSPRFLTNILLVTVGSNFGSRDAWNNFPELWALRTQFTAHFSSFWLQTSQISSFEVGSTAKEAFFHITYRYVEINCSALSWIIPLSHCAFTTASGMFLRVDKNLGDVTQLKLPWRIGTLGHVTPLDESILIVQDSVAQTCSEAQPKKVHVMI
jgi:hypothetical protein